jgi:hypothetical protein
MQRLAFYMLLPEGRPPKYCEAHSSVLPPKSKKRPVATGLFIVYFKVPLLPPTVYAGFLTRGWSK